MRTKEVAQYLVSSTTVTRILERSKHSQSKANDNSNQHIVYNQMLPTNYDQQQNPEVDNTQTEIMKGSQIHDNNIEVVQDTATSSN